jgi:hypothetical protein
MAASWTDRTYVIAEIRAGTQRSIKASTGMLGIYDTDG